MGRWSANHRKKAIFGWLAFVRSPVVIGNAVGSGRRQTSRTRSATPAKADQILDDHFPTRRVRRSSSSRRKGRTVADARLTRARSTPWSPASPPLRFVQRSTRRSNRGTAARSPRTGAPSLVELRDRTATTTRPRSRSIRSTAAVATVVGAQPDFYVGEFGDASSDKALDKPSTKTSRRPGTLSVPLTLLILVLAFGALRRRGHPADAGPDGGDGHARARAITSHASRWTKTSARSCLLVGLAVGVDYTLFYLRREREERGAGERERGRDGSRRRDLGTRRADLRLDGDGRDGGDVVRRRPRRSRRWASPRSWSSPSR